MKFLPLLILIVTLCGCLRNTDSGMVAHFPFDGDADEKLGSEVSCTVEGATLTTDRFGIAENAYFFDGKDNQVYGELKNMPALEAAQSFCWWYLNESLPIFSDPLGAGNMIVLADSEAGVGIQFGFRASGYGTRGLDSWNWGGKTLLDVEPAEIDTWHFCVYTFDGITHRFFIDGMEMASSTETTQQGNPTTLMFGNYPGGDQFFEGKLDDIRIYNRALAPSEINTLYLRKD